MNKEPGKDLAKAKLLGETAVVPWRELQKFFAAGQAVYISETLDLVEVAYQMSRDNRQHFENYLARELVVLVSEQQALDWYEREQQMWAVVVRPWVLVQPVGSSQDSA